MVNWRFETLLIRLSNNFIGQQPMTSRNSPLYTNFFLKVMSLNVLPNQGTSWTSYLLGGRSMLVSRELDSAYWALRIAFGLGPVLAGLDKFTNIRVNLE